MLQRFLLSFLVVEQVPKRQPAIFRREQKKRTRSGEASAIEEGTHGAMGKGTLEPLLFPGKRDGL